MVKLIFTWIDSLIISRTTENGQLRIQKWLIGNNYTEKRWSYCDRKCCPISNQNWNVLESVAENCSEVRFQQDGATAYMARSTMQIFSDIFSKHLISKHCIFLLAPVFSKFEEIYFFRLGIHIWRERLLNKPGTTL